MRTDELIRALAADADKSAPMPLSRALMLGLLPGLALSGLIYVLFVGPRPHLLALSTVEPRIAFKFLLSLALAGCAGFMLLRLVRPGSDLRPALVLLLLVALALIAGVIGELMVLPHDLWAARWIGHNSMHCLKTIPPLSAAPFVAAFIVMRRGAPDHPALAGAGIGLFAAAIGATIYATHCPDDSPLFVATWYGIAIAGVTALGAIAGSRLLRW